MLYMLDIVNYILNSAAQHHIPEENQDRCHVSSACPTTASPLTTSRSLKRSLVLTPSRPILPSDRDARLITPHPLRAGVSPPWGAAGIC